MNNKWLDRIIIIFMIFAIGFSFLLMTGRISFQNNRTYDRYAGKLFDQSYVHNIDIFIEDFPKFLSEASKEQYIPANLVIDGEKFSEIGLRTKGNNSLNLTEKYGHQRFSMKLEFDHYEDKTYHGLDKFSLDSSFQDNAYLKTYLAFDMMRFMGVKTPLFSYSWVRINNQDWGLFLAIEEIEESFARRNYGIGYGQIYKAAYRNLNEPNYDIKLIYTNDDFNNYQNLFDNAKFKIEDSDKKRLINALKIIADEQNLDQAVDIEAMLRYFVVQVFVVNLDSYLGATSHNYFLYEEEGIVSMLPWDYNLAFATYSLGMPNPINDSNLYINFPIDTPNKGEIMLNRPLYHNMMKNPEYFRRYHELFDFFLKEYFESGYFTKNLESVENLIEPYVAKDPTAFINYSDHKVGVRTIEEFCLLRAKSIRGQLEGTIPSTIKGQEEYPEKIIDASHLKLEDMGEVADLKDGVH